MKRHGGRGFRQKSNDFQLKIIFNNGVPFELEMSNFAKMSYSTRILLTKPTE